MAGLVVGHLLVPVAFVPGPVLFPLALLPVVGRVGLVLLFVERFVVGPVVVSCHGDGSGVVARCVFV